MKSRIVGGCMVKRSGMVLECNSYSCEICKNYLIDQSMNDQRFVSH